MRRLGVSSVGTSPRSRSRPGRSGSSDSSRRVAETLDAIRRAPGDPPPLAVTALTFGDDAPARGVGPGARDGAAATRARRGEIETSSWTIRRRPRPSDERWASRTLPFAAFETCSSGPIPNPRSTRPPSRRRRGASRPASCARSCSRGRCSSTPERELDLKQLLWRLRAVDPDCYAFADAGHGVRAGGDRSSARHPNCSCRRRGRDVEATPLAGSAQRFGDPARDRAAAAALFRSEKDREEHAVVVEDVARVLGSFCDALDHPHEPELLGTANVWHLATPFRGRLHTDTSVLELVAALHPTPAVAGLPRDAAIDVLGELEPIDRGGYAGPLGWVDANGDGEFAIALRCAEITGKTARLFAGAGIVADSVPEAEVDETERKFRALLDALRWG